MRLLPKSRRGRVALAVGLAALAAGCLWWLLTPSRLPPAESRLPRPMAAATPPEGPVYIHDLEGNVRARLVAARISWHRSQHLEAKLRTVDEGQPEEFLASFHDGETPHTATLERLA